MIKTLMKNIFTPLLARIRALEYSMGLIADYVVETGTSGIWTYEKWESGKAVAYGSSTNTVTYDSKISSSSYLYQSGGGATVSMPSGVFTAVNGARANGYNVSDDGWAVLCSCHATLSSIKIAPIGWCTGGSFSQVFQLEVIGTWK